MSLHCKRKMRAGHAVIRNTGSLGFTVRCVFCGAWWDVSKNYIIRNEDTLITKHLRTKK